MSEKPVTNEAPASQDATKSSKTTVLFVYKSIWDHARCLPQYWKPFTLCFLASFGSLWSVFSALVYSLDVDLRGGRFLIVSVCASLAAGLIRVVYLYLHACPDGFESEPPYLWRIAQIQRPRWQFRLAKCLLEEKVRHLDNDLQDLTEGRVFVATEKRLCIVDYVKWGQCRISDVGEMVRVATELLVRDLPRCLAMSEKEPANPADILRAVNRIRSLYAESVAFELAHRRVKPPDVLASLHSLQKNWTYPVRDAVKQVFQFLDTVIDLDRRPTHHVSFTITVKEISTVDAYCREFDRLAPRLSRMVAEDPTS